MTTKQLPSGIDKFFKSNFLKIEIVLAFLVIIGLLMDYYEIGSSSSALIGISLTTIATLYFLGGSFAPDPSDKTFATIGYRVLHIGWSVIIVGLMFKILHLPGAPSMVNLGSGTMAVALLVVIATSLGNWSSRASQAIVRSLVIYAVLFFLLYPIE